MDLDGEGARASAAPPATAVSREKEREGRDSAGAFYRKVLDVFSNSKQVQCSGEEWTAGWIFYFDRVVFVKP